MRCVAALTSDGLVAHAHCHSCSRVRAHTIACHVRHNHPHSCNRSIKFGKNSDGPYQLQNTLNGITSLDLKNKDYGKPTVPFKSKTNVW